MSRQEIRQRDMRQQLAHCFSRCVMPCLLLVLSAASVVRAEHELSTVFLSRGFSVDNVELPNAADNFPVKQLANLRFTTIAAFDWFPEGPSYRAAGDSYFFSGAQALTRIDSKGKRHEILGSPGGGGTHFLPDGSVLIIGHMGLRRVYRDGRIELLADGKVVGKGNDITVGRYREVYFSVPGHGVYRLTPGDSGQLDRVIQQGTNGLEVDPKGEYLYVVRAAVQRYAIHGLSKPLGAPETVCTFPKGQGGGDGCTFDAWGNLYTMRFKTGVIRVIDPQQKKQIAEMPVGVVPASNLTFGGPRNTELFVTAGSPKAKNCQVLKASTEITGFCGHAGAISYPVLRVLDETANAKAFTSDNTKEN